MTAILELRNIEVTRGQTRILRDLNWTIREGQNWVLFGPNGAGKTTLLNVMTGYIWPSNGSVTVLGERLGEIELRELRRHVALVSEPLRLMVHDDLEGLEVLVTGARGHLSIFDPVTPYEEERAHDIASRLGLESLLAKQFGVLSTGERQRLLIGRALMCDPRIVILDEPCAGLDLAMREFVLETIDAVYESGTRPCFILTTHHVEEITGCFTHALLLSRGTVQGAGPLVDTMNSLSISHLFGRPVDLHRINGRLTAVIAP